MKNRLNVACSIGFCSLAITLSAQNTQQFTSIGANTFTIPPSVIELQVEAIGGGGNGGRVEGTSSRESGGGGGGAYAKGHVKVTPGQIYSLYVGENGLQNGNYTTGRHGGNSWFKSGNSTNADSVVRAEGGQSLILSGGSNKNGQPGGKAANSVGNIAVFDGGNGGTTNNNDYGGGGGAAASANGPGANGGQQVAGVGNGPFAGNGGVGGVDGGQDHGQPGTNYGAGGGGSRKSSSLPSSVNRWGGDGAPGIVILSWSEIVAFSPAVVCANGTSTVVVTGDHLSTASVVEVNGIPAQFVVDNNTQITVTIPSNATTGRITVKTDFGKVQTLTDVVIEAGAITIDQTNITWEAQYTGSNDATYQWVDCANNNTPIAGATAHTFTPTQNGLYAVVVSDNGCTFTSDCYTYNRVDVEEKEQLFGLFPNPSNGIFTLQSQKTNIESVKIFDVAGKLLSQMNIHASSATIDASHLPSGTYFIGITTKENTSFRKIIIQ